jgi:hypothetical protein
VPLRDTGAVLVSPDPARSDSPGSRTRAGLLERDAHFDSLALRWCTCPPARGMWSGKTLNRPVMGIAATPSGAGYWLVAADGGIFTFGDAPFAGSDAK